MMRPQRERRQKEGFTGGLENLDARAHQIQQGAVRLAEARPRSDRFDVRREIALVEELMEPVARDEELESVQIAMLADDHLGPVTVPAQQGWEAEVIMGVAGLHRRLTLAGIVGAEGGKQSAGRLDPIGEEVLKIDALPPETIQEGRDPDPMTVAVQEAPVQGLHEDDHDIGRSGQPDAGTAVRGSHPRVPGIRKLRSVSDQFLCYT